MKTKEFLQNYSGICYRCLRRRLHVSRTSRVALTSRLYISSFVGDRLGRDLESLFLFFCVYKRCAGQVIEVEDQWQHSACENLVVATFICSLPGMQAALTVRKRWTEAGGPRGSRPYYKGVANAQRR